MYSAPLPSARLISTSSMLSEKYSVFDFDLDFSFWSSFSFSYLFLPTTKLTDLSKTISQSICCLSFCFLLLSQFWKSPSVNELDNELTVFLHKPMPSIKPMHLTIGRISQVLQPPLPMKLERLLLRIQVNHRH
jgi:hypothetical protein